MRRRRFNIVASLSFVLLVATLALWVLSYWRWCVIMNPEHGIPPGVLRTRTAASWFRGEVIIGMARQRATYGEGWWFSVRVDDKIKMFMNAFYVTYPTRLGGFGYHAEYDPDGQWMRILAFPLWSCAAVLSLCPLLWLWRTQKLRRRRRNGCCIECGYDLKGNVSGVCPECGSNAQNIASVSTRGIRPQQ